MRLNKLESCAILSNKKLYLRACGLTINPNFGKGGTADFTSRELDRLADSIQAVESDYYQNLKDSQMPTDTDTGPAEPADES